MLVDRCPGTAQLKKIRVLPSQNPQQNFYDLIFQNKGTAGANHHDSLFFLSYSLLLSPLMSSHRTAKTFFIK